MFVYCPCCGEHQTKVGDATEIMFCNVCVTEWVEPRKKKGRKKK